jgi:hypothetical protein
MRCARLVLALVMVAMISGSAMAFSNNTWTGGTGGNWKDDANWSEATPDYTNDTFSLSTNGDRVDAVVGDTFAAQLTVNAGTTLRLPVGGWGTSSMTASNVHLNGGVLFGDCSTNKYPVLSGAITVDADSQVKKDDVNNSTYFRISSTITGAAGRQLELVTHDGDPLDPGAVRLNADNSATYAGDWLLSDGRLYVEANNALGTGTTTVTDNAVLELAAVANAVTQVDVESGGHLRAVGSSNGCSNAHLAGGSTLTFLVSTNAGRTTSGNFHIDGDIVLLGGSAINASRHDVTATLHGSGAIRVDYNNGGKGFGYVDIEADNSATFSGNWSLIQGDLGISNNGALGTGSLGINGGYLRFVSSNMSITVDRLFLSGVQYDAGTYDVDTEIASFGSYFIGNTGGTTSITILTGPPPPPVAEPAGLGLIGLALLGLKKKRS